MKRIAILVAGVLSQICLGTMYAWSVFGQNLRSIYAFSASQTELMYGIAIGTFAIGTIVTGRLVYKLGPRLMTLISAVLFALAFIGASLSHGNYDILLICLGPILGIAIAFGYVCPLSTAVAWFPHHKGLVTGLAVMGFGGGAFISSSIARQLFSQGHSILEVFAIIGVAGAIIIALASIFLRLPKQRQTIQATKAQPSYKPGLAEEAVPRILSHGKLFHQTAIFWTLCIAMFLGTIGGLIVIGSVMNMAQEYGFSDIAPWAMGLLTLGNAGGRLLWGIVMDKMGSRAIITSFVVMILGFTFLGAGAGSATLFLTGLFITGLQFGASLVIFATYTERYYGAGAIGRVYPWIFACYGVAAIIGPYLGGLAHDATGSFQQVMIVLSCIPIAGALISLFGIRSTHAVPR